MDKDKRDMKVEIKVDEGIATGVFSNFANMSHSSDEFVIDFLFVNPSCDKDRQRGGPSGNSQDLPCFLMTVVSKLNSIFRGYGSELTVQ